MSRPLEEWEHHVRVADATRPREVWCGAQTNSMRWDFTSIDHVAAHRTNGGRLLPCPACLKAIVEALQSQ